MTIRDWKREHRVAFWLAVLLGAFFGFVGATQYTPPIFGSGEGWSDFSYFGHECGTFAANLLHPICGGELHRWLVPLPIGILIGGIIGGALIYIWELMRK